MVTTLKCGCTLDTDFVGTEHFDKAPHHVVLKGNSQAPSIPLPPPESEPEAEPFDEPEDKQKKRR